MERSRIDYAPFFTKQERCQSILLVKTLQIPVNLFINYILPGFSP